MTTIETKKLLEYRLNGTDLIYDCQFHPDHHDWIGFSTIEGDIKMYVCVSFCCREQGLFTFSFFFLI